MSKALCGKKEKEDIKNIVNHIKNRTPQGLKIINNFRETFQLDIKDAKLAGGRGKHFDLEILVQDNSNGNEIWKTVEHKGTQKYVPIPENCKPWVNGVQFYNGGANKFSIGRKYAVKWYEKLIYTGYITFTYFIESPIPTLEEWLKQDAFRQGDPKTNFGAELKRTYREYYGENSSLLEDRERFVQKFEINNDDLEILKKEVFDIAYKVLNEKDYWLQIYGDVNGNFNCKWSPKFLITQISHINFKKKKDIIFQFICNDNLSFNGILRWGKGAGFSNIRLDLK